MCLQDHAAHKSPTRCKTGRQRKPHHHQAMLHQVWAYNELQMSHVMTWFGLMKIQRSLSNWQAWLWAERNMSRFGRYACWLQLKHLEWYQVNENKLEVSFDLMKMEQHNVRVCSEYARKTYMVLDCVRYQKLRSKKQACTCLVNSLSLSSLRER